MDYLHTISEAAGPAFLLGKGAIFVGLLWCAVALRSSFLAAFGAAVGLMTASYFVDLNTAVGQEADILISLLSTCCFATAVLIISGSVSANPTPSVALLLALMGMIGALANAVHADKPLIEIYDAASSCGIVVALAAIVSLLCYRRRPWAATVLAVTGLAFGAAQAGYFVADFLHHRIAMGALTVLYCGMVGALAIDRDMDGKPKGIFAPRAVFATLHDAVAVAAKVVAARMTRILR
jgi:hypothetical protein